MRRSWIWIPSLSALVLAAVTSLAAAQQLNISTPQTTTTPTPFDQTAKFLRSVAMTETFETVAARTALSRSTSEAVLRYAQGVMDEQAMLWAHIHSATNGEARITAATSPFGPDEARREIDDRRKLEQLRQSSPAAFDAAYLAMEEKERHKALEMFRDYALDGVNRPLQLVADQAAVQTKRRLEQLRDFERQEAIAKASP